MDIDEVPEGHWMILDEHRKVLFHSKDLKEVAKKGNEHSTDVITIERKYSGLIF